MQSILRNTSLPISLNIQTNLGHVTQVRNHVKIYPWRFNRGNRECYLDTSKVPYTVRHNINEFKSSKKQKKPWQEVIPKDKDNRFNSFRWNDAYKSDPKAAKETAGNKLTRFNDSLRNRGAARESIAYNPPDDVQERIISLYKASLLKDHSNIDLADDNSILDVDINQTRTLKLNLIKKCIVEFKHDVQSSHLNDILCIRDLIEYFSTPVRGVNPYAALLRQEDSLPVNLSLISEPIRFNKETDEFFKGYTAYPGLVSNVPGLRAAKKHPVLNQDEFQWPDI